MSIGQVGDLTSLANNSALGLISPPSALLSLNRHHPPPRAALPPFDRFYHLTIHFSSQGGREGPDWRRSPPAGSRNRVWSARCISCSTVHGNKKREFRSLGNEATAVLWGSVDVPKRSVISYALDNPRPRPLELGGRPSAKQTNRPLSLLIDVISFSLSNACVLLLTPFRLFRLRHAS